MTPLDAVRPTEARLAEAGVDSPRLDAEYLVADVLGLPNAHSTPTRRRLSPRRPSSCPLGGSPGRAREPLAYILGEWDFRNLTLQVDHRVLVPRPETEVVVERA